MRGTALRFGTALRIDDAPADPLFFEGVDRHTGRATRALLCAPFTSRRGVFGVIEAVNPRDAAAFSDDDLALLDAFARSLANAFDNLESPCQPESSDRDGGLPPAGDVFRQEGEYWTLVFEGRVARLRDAKGLHYIACLLRHPGQDVHVCDLLAVGGEAQPCRALGCQQSLRLCGLGDAGPLLDAKAKAAYKRRLDDLRGELEETERMNLAAALTCATRLRRSSANCPPPSGWAAGTAVPLQTRNVPAWGSPNASEPPSRRFGT
ncbi:MAG: GAF domain-containing protein [Candidatus Binatia bacterium]